MSEDRPEPQLAWLIWLNELEAVLGLRLALLLSIDEYTPSSCSIGEVMFSTYDWKEKENEKKETRERERGMVD